MDRPNIVHITCHDLGRHLGCYGVRSIRTPNIDSLAEDGVRFTNYFCTAPQCSPSRGSAITGLYPHENGLMGLAHLGWEIDDSCVKLPQALGSLGYTTMLFGIQHETGGDPKALGYQSVHQGRTAEEVTEAFIQSISTTETSPPFYAALGYVEPHRPFDLEGYDPDPAAEVDPLPYIPDDERIRREIGQMQGTIKAVDAAVGRLLPHLPANTLLIFTTDHGIAFPRAKGMLYDPGVGIACIMRWPEVIAEGTLINQLLSNVDLMPTLIRLAGGRACEGLSGRSFHKLLLGGDYKERDDIFLEITWHDRYNPMRAVRTRTLKYIRSFGNRPLVYLPADIYVSPSGEVLRDSYYSQSRPEEELYDLEKDPLEQKNLLRESSYFPSLQRLRQRMSGLMELTDDPLLKGPVPGRREDDRPDLALIPSEPTL